MISLNSGIKSVLPFIALLLIIQLSACKKDETVRSELSNSGSDNIIKNENIDFHDKKDPTEIDVSFGGSIGDGPIINASVYIYDKNNNLLVTESSSNTADFKTNFKTKKENYPLTIKVEGGTDIVTWHKPDFVMSSVVFSPNDKQVNVNPFTTLIVNTARLLPGSLTQDNIKATTDIVMKQLNFGFSPDYLDSPFNTVITASNVAYMVKSSEALSEVLRRTRDSLSSAGISTNADEVLMSISHDLVDGEIDGKGALFANNRLSALVTLNSAKVITEVLSNALIVEGMPATELMDNAILTTRPSVTPDQLTSDIKVNQAILDQVNKAMKYAVSINPSEELINLSTTLGSITANSPTKNIEALLSVESSNMLDLTINHVLSMDEATLNEFVPEPVVEEPVIETTKTPEYVALSISGKPDSVVLENSPYSFIPETADGNANNVTFTIVNLPSWAHFYKKTGELYGVPGSTHIGIYENIVISANDGSNTVELPAFSITVKNVNDAPTISGNPLTTIAVSNFYNFQPSAYDLDADTLKFTIDNKPKWATFDSTNGNLSGTPTTRDIGLYSKIIITVSDGSASQSLASFNIKVTATNKAPTISGTPSNSVNAGSEYVFQPIATDADGNKLSFSAKNLPIWASFNSNTGLLSGTPENSDAGTYSNIVISVTDGQETTELSAFSIKVVAINNAPTISGNPVNSLNAGDNYSFQPTATDTDNDTLVFAVKNLPTWAKFDTTTGLFSGTPQKVNAGTFNNITISVTDGKATAQLTPFAITVVVSNTAPSISGSPTSSVNAGSNYSFKPVASDVDGDSLTFNASNLPAWATLNSTTGLVSGTPSKTDAGTYSNIVISVTDGKATAQLAPFAITVVVLNTAPSISGTPAESVNVYSNYNFQPTASDAEGDSLTFSVSNLPSWATFNTKTGSISGTPFRTATGTYSNIVITVTDGQATAQLAPFTITVGVVNSAPSISGTPASNVNTGSYYSFQPVASDAEGDSLTFSVSNLPTWAAFNTKTGSISGTPSKTQSGTNSNIVIAVTDGKSTSKLAPFDITVTLSNTAPSISGTPASNVNAGNNYSFKPVASDVDGDSLQFSVSNLPLWATFSTSTGLVSGTPNKMQNGTYNNIVISVTDGKETTSLPAFFITVVMTNNLPVISNVPATSVQAGSVYNFTPSAYDKDGDTLTFIIENLPTWAQFDTSTGKLTGAPTINDSGIYENVTISVTDGVNTASLPTFDIQVKSGVGSAVLNWIAPTHFSDGSLLSYNDIAGYKVYYGTMKGDYSKTVDITDGKAISVTIDNLKSDTYYFVVSTVGANGFESPQSDVVSQTFAW